jgi:3-methyl-2-oxobutanoate hydroxymethyltransferase
MSAPHRVTVTDLQAMRERGERITMLTAYDYSTARIADEAGIPILLVGDSLGMVVLGYDSTLPVTVDDMVRHGAAVVRGAQRAHVVVDMPFGSYQGGWQDAMRNAVRIMQETGAGSVKLEGGERSAEIVRHLVAAGIPVMGHIGLTPQSVNAFGGWRMQGKTPRDGIRLMADAKALENAGAYAIVLETVPASLAAKITQQVSIPTIGIGAGPYCDGQVQVVHDLLGLFQDFKPKHARRFLEGADLIRGAIEEYRQQVETGAFPTAAESHGLDDRMKERIERIRIHRTDQPIPVRPQRRSAADAGSSEASYLAEPARTDLERHPGHGGAVEE